MLAWQRADEYFHLENNALQEGRVVFLADSEMNISYLSRKCPKFQEANIISKLEERGRERIAVK